MTDEQKSVFPYRGKPFEKEQIELFSAVCISSFVDHVATNVSGRWIGGNEEESFSRWIDDRRSDRKRDYEIPTMVHDALEILGWNLSILYAQITNDGTGVADALETADLGETLDTWAMNWCSGKLGIVRDSTNPKVGKPAYPNVSELAINWTNEVWRLIHGQ